MDVVYASTGAEDVGGGNIQVGVTAHCRCGHQFCWDVVAGARNIGRE